MESSSKINSVQKDFFSMDKYATGLPMLIATMLQLQRQPQQLQQHRPQRHKRQQRAHVLMVCTVWMTVLVSISVLMVTDTQTNTAQVIILKITNTFLCKKSSGGKAVVKNS